MTETRDFDRLARAWLDLMPDEAPDRVIDAVLQAVDVTPQRRTSFDPAIRRFFAMNRLTYAAIALAFVVLGGGALLLAQFRQPNVGPSQAPTATPLSAPTRGTGAPLPAQLQARWFGGTRTLAGLEAGAGTVLRLEPGTFKVAQANQQDATLFGGAASSLDGRIEIQRGSGPALTCGTDIGSYAYSLSTSGQTLTLSDARDSCAIRRSTLVGTWWRIDCKGSQDPGDAPACLGLMDAGTYGSQYWIPTLASGQTDWTPRYAGVTFTVPDGWANFADWPNWFGLGRGADFAGLAKGEWTPDFVELVTNAMAESQATPCSNTPASGVGNTPGSVVRFIGGLSSLQVTTPTAITIDGKAGLTMDIVVSKQPTKLCGGTDAVVEFVLGEPWIPPTENPDVSTDGMRVGEKQRLILIDAGGGVTTAVIIHVADASRFDTFVSEAMPIVQSMHFN
jgi:hypothetical protein